MSDDIEDGSGGGTEANAAGQPGESDAAKRRSKLEELARRRAEQAPKAAETVQEVLPPEADRGGKLRELLRNRRQRGAGGEGRLGRRGGGLGAAGDGEGGRRGEVLRRLLENRRSGDNNRGDGEARGGRLLRRLRERGGRERGAGGAGNGPARRGAELEERIRRLEDELDELRDGGADPTRSNRRGRR